MRKTMFMLALLLAGCSGGGNGPPPGGGTGGGGNGPPPTPTVHAPIISNLYLSPGNVTYMAGDGQVTITAELNFQDSGYDIRTLWLEMPDGARAQFAEAWSALTGTVREQITISTKTAGAFTIKGWLVDRAGDSSNQLSATFYVLSNVPASAWTNRMTPQPFVLNDVVWNGDNFVAVGGAGKVLTANDGIDWVVRQSGTEAELVAVASRGPDVVAVGYDATVLTSTNGGASWVRKHSGEPIRLAAVAMSASQIVVGGMHLQTGEAFIMRSSDRGESWAVASSVPHSGHFVTDLVYANGIFVAATDANSSESAARVMVSSNGEVWNELILRTEATGLHGILHDGRQFIVGGRKTVFVSLDGYNWTELDTPVDRVDYRSAAWNGSRLVVAGGITWWFWWLGTPNFERPVGLSSTDGGVTWEIFNIDGYYQSNGMAWGNGRFVSVGESTPVSGLGAIYTSG